MTQAIFRVPAISCDHCIATIKRTLLAVEGVTQVTGDAQAKRIEVVFDRPASREAIVAALIDEGYPPADTIDK